MENKEAVEVDFAITLILQIRSSKFCMVVDLDKMHIYKLYRGGGFMGLKGGHDLQ